VLKGAGWPADAAKIRAAMENVKVDTAVCAAGDRVEQGQSLPHRQYYRVYRWDPTKAAITVAKIGWPTRSGLSNQ